MILDPQKKKKKVPKHKRAMGKLKREENFYIQARRPLAAKAGDLHMPPKFGGSYFGHHHTAP